MTITTSPPHALTVFVSMDVDSVKPSSEMYPRFLNAAFNAVFASVGKSVPKGAWKKAPPTLGVPAVTFAELFVAICYSLLLIVS